MGSEFWGWAMLFVAIFLAFCVGSAVSRFKDRRRKKREKQKAAAWAKHLDNPTRLIRVLGGPEEYVKLTFVFPDTALNLVRTFNEEQNKAEAQLETEEQRLGHIEAWIADKEKERNSITRASTPQTELQWRGVEKELTRLKVQKNEQEGKIFRLRSKTYDNAALQQLISLFRFVEKQLVIARGTLVYQHFPNADKNEFAAFRRIFLVDGQYVLANYHFDVTYGNDVGRYPLDDIDYIQWLGRTSQFSDEEVQIAANHAQSKAAA